MPTQPDRKAIRQEIHKKYAAVARGADGKFSYPVGRQGLEQLGYDTAITDRASPDFLATFCGVGNPFALGNLTSGSSVLDVGCGGGFDLFVAGHLVGPVGSVCGVDLTAEMVRAARRNLTLAGMSNVRVCQGNAELLPFPDGTFDVVISNGVLNLSPDKSRAFAEINRVLRTGGRLQMADIVVDGELPRDIVGSLEAWSG